MIFKISVPERKDLKCVPCHWSLQILDMFIVKALKACLAYKHSYHGGDRKKKVKAVNNIDHILQDRMI